MDLESGEDKFEKTESFQTGTYGLKFLPQSKDIAKINLQTGCFYTSNLADCVKGFYLLERAGDNAFMKLCQIIQYTCYSFCVGQ